jgi:hypothetical protein
LSSNNANRDSEIQLSGDEEDEGPSSKIGGGVERRVAAEDDGAASALLKYPISWLDERGGGT